MNKSLLVKPGILVLVIFTLFVGVCIIWTLANRGNKPKQPSKTRENQISLPDHSKPPMKKDEAADGGNAIRESDATSVELQDPAPAIDSAKTFIKRGFVELNRMNLDRAKALFVEAKRIDPKQPKVWFGLGQVAFQKQEYDKAATLVQKAVKLKPGNYLWRKYLGQIHLTMGNLKEAKKELTRVLKIHPNDQEAIELIHRIEQKGES